MPKSIAVCMPIGGYSSEGFGFQRLHWLARVVQDLNSQTMQPDEVIVAINGNVSHEYTPRLFAILKDIAAPHQILTSKYQISASENFLRTVQHSACDYFSFWSDHDLHSACFLEVLMEELEAHQNLALAGTVYNHVDESECITTSISSLCQHFAADMNSAGKRLAALLTANSTGAVYGVINRMYFQKCSRKVESYGPDILLVYELAKHGGIKILDQVLWTERSRSTSTTHSSQRHSEFFNPTSLYSGLSTPITHHLLTCHQIFEDLKYFSSFEQRSLRALSMQICERRFISFACLREMGAALTQLRRNLARINPWGAISNTALLAFQAYWLVHLILSGVIFREFRDSLKRGALGASNGLVPRSAKKT